MHMQIVRYKDCLLLDVFRHSFGRGCRSDNGENTSNGRMNDLPRSIRRSPANIGIGKYFLDGTRPAPVAPSSPTLTLSRPFPFVPLTPVISFFLPLRLCRFSLFFASVSRESKSRSWPVYRPDVSQRLTRSLRGTGGRVGVGSPCSL